MNPFRLLSLTVGLSACAFTNVYNLLTVKAQPKRIRRAEDLRTRKPPKRVKVPEPYVDLEDDVFEEGPSQGAQTSSWQRPEDIVERRMRMDEVCDENVYRSARQDLLTWTSHKDGGIIFPHPRYPKREILEYKDFAMCYDNEKRSPCWILEKLTDDNFNPFWRCESIHLLPIREDYRVNSTFRPQFGDFRRVSNTTTIYHFTSTILYRDYNDLHVDTNVFARMLVNEDPGERTIWNELDEYIGNLKKVFPFVYVLTGPLYIPTKNQAGRTVVQYHFLNSELFPLISSFFKVILIQHEDKSFGLECYAFPNYNRGSIDIRNYIVSRKRLEDATGFQIFDEVKDSSISTNKTLDKYYVGKLDDNPDDSPDDSLPDDSLPDDSLPDDSLPDEGFRW